VAGETLPAPKDWTAKLAEPGINPTIDPVVDPVFAIINSQYECALLAAKVSVPLSTRSVSAAPLELLTLVVTLIDLPVATAPAGMVQLYNVLSVLFPASETGPVWQRRLEAELLRLMARMNITVAKKAVVLFIGTSFRFTQT
jgi:hypothetical protein